MDRSLRHALIDRLAAIAASPAERAGAPWADARPTDPMVLDERRTAWRAAVARGDEERFRALTSARGLDDLAIDARLREIHVRDAPPWARAVRAWLDHADEHPQVTDATCAALDVRVAGHDPSLPVEVRHLARPHPAGSATATVSLFAWARAELDAMPGDARWSPAARDDLAAALCRLVARAWDRADDGRGLRGDASDDAWTARLEDAPALTRLTGRIIENWRRNTVELVTHVAQDHDAIATTFSITTTRVERALAGLSAPHEGGRSPTMLVLPDGAVVHKPRDQRLAAGIASLARVLGTEGDDDRHGPLLRATAVLTRDGYGWERAVPAAPAEAVDWTDVARSLGAWTRVASLLGARDLGRSNVVVQHDALVVIDTEALLPVDLITDISAHAGDGRQAPPTAHALLATGLLAAPVGVAGADEDIGDASLAADDRGAPLVGRSTAIVGGFDAAHHALVAARRQLLERAGVFGEHGPLAGTLVRTLIRPDHLYVLLDRASRAAPANADGITRELALERLWLAWSHDLEPVIAAEVDALRDGDLPLFAARAGTTDVCWWTPDAEGSAPVVAVDPLVRARAAITALRDAPAEGEVDAIRTLLHVARPDARADEPGPTLGPAASVDDPQVLARATALGRDLLSWIDAGDLVLQASPWTGAVRLVPLPDDLADGTAGLAVVVHDLATATGDDQLRDGAAHLRRDLDARAERWVAATRPRPPGAYAGGAGLVFALARTGGLGPSGAALLDRVLADAERWPADRPCGLALGVPGLLVVAAGLEATILTGEQAARLAALARRLGEAPTRASTDAPRPIPSEVRRMGAPFTSVPPPAIAIRFALARFDGTRHLGAPTSTEGDDPSTISRSTADGRSEPVVGLLEAAARREPSERAVAARAVLDSVADDDGGRALGTTTEGRLVGIEAALLAGTTDARARGRDLAIRILDEHERAGRWFPEALAADRHRLSALWGAAAVAHTLVRVSSDPIGDPGSIRLLDLPRR